MQSGAVDNLPKRLREKRKKAGLTLEQAADKVGLSVSQVSRLERGESEITLSQVQRFADAYDFRLNDLLRDESQLGEVIVKASDGRLSLDSLKDLTDAEVPIVKAAISVLEGCVH